MPFRLQFLTLCGTTFFLQDKPNENNAAEQQDTDQGEPEKNESEKPKKKIDMSPIDKRFGKLTKISKNGEVWLAKDKKTIVVGGKICRQQGPLEMFACTPETKEHESIVVINGKAFEVHAGLLALGAKSGSPVKWDPKYEAATGEEISVEVHWLDKKGKPQMADARKWILNHKTKKPMRVPWVFAGSEFYKDERTGERFYLAEGGEFVCLSNFSTAMLDIPVKSSDLNSGLSYYANDKAVPPVKTPVRLAFKIAEKKKDTPKNSSKEKKKSDSKKSGEKESDNN